ncbi:MAG: hypothetical protein ACTSXD_02065 [Candidatus Heimdallarchaeaceae archaeon]
MSKSKDRPRKNKKIKKEKNSKKRSKINQKKKIVDSVGFHTSFNLKIASSNKF